jgi:N-acetylglucosaminyldiphosphoundecaprenol N-acetyl-beta-D-mannosaminyltransferase
VDGIVGKWFLQLKGVKVEKVPGVQLLEQAMSSGLIDEITIFGSCSDEFRDLCNKRRIKIVYERQLLDFDLNNFVLPKDAALAKVVIIALPSPKQELLAFEISQKCDDSKILCIGGAMNMVCNDKLTAPAWVNKMNLEWIFRLKTDTKRRLVRLFTSFVRALLNLRILRDCAVCLSFEGKKKR